MKRYLTVFALLYTLSTAHGAHFIYYGGGLRANYDDVYAENLPYFNGPWSLTQNGTFSASVMKTAGGSPQPYGHAYNYIQSKIVGNSIRIQSESIAEGAADYSYCFARGQGFAGTGNSHINEKGLYYQITPDTNEQAGDDVMVYYNDIVNIKATGTTDFIIGGPGTMNHLAITRGQLPPVTTEPDRENEVLSFNNVEVSNSGDSSWFSGVYAFPAKIGDVIGIFAKNYTRVEGWGFLRGSIYNTHTMILTVRAVLSGDLDYDNDVDFYDLAKLANNWLEGVGIEPPLDTTPPTPDPVQWASVPKEVNHGGGTFDHWAEMTAAIATDPSGGVQYYFDCTSESGFSSGWQGSPYYEVQVGSAGHYLFFRVKARDIHDNVSLNWSTELPAVP